LFPWHQHGALFSIRTARFAHTPISPSAFKLRRRTPLPPPLSLVSSSDLIPGYCVPKMFTRKQLAAGFLVSVHPAPWECWMTHHTLAEHGTGMELACSFVLTGVPCDCACGCGWGNLGCGWACEARNRSQFARAPVLLSNRTFPPPPWWAVGSHVAWYERESRCTLENAMGGLPRHGPSMGGTAWAYGRRSWRANDLHVRDVIEPEEMVGSS
jgi:hypothetical protein